MFWFPNNKFQLSPPPENSRSMNMHVWLWCANHPTSSWMHFAPRSAAELRTKAGSFCQTDTQHGFLPPFPALGMLNSFKDLLDCLIFKSCRNLTVQCRVQWNWHWCVFWWLPRSGNWFIPVTWKYKIRSFAVTLFFRTCWVITVGFAREKQGVRRQGNASPTL